MVEKGKLCVVQLFLCDERSFLCGGWGFLCDYLNFYVIVFLRVPS
jgi:hypothetical protein